MEDVSDSRLAGGWLKMQLALLHASEEERSLKGMSFEDYKRAFILEPPGEKMEPSLFVAQDFEVGHRKKATYGSPTHCLGFF